MLENKLISIILPVYNVADYLQTCLDSILNQTYRNIEIICIDDGSTDGSGEICDNYAKKDLRIKVIHQGNQGVSKARNVGLQICNGEYIGFVDSDDWLEPQMYERLVQALNCKKTIGVAMCGYFMNYESEEKKIINRRPVPQKIIPMSQMLYYIYRRDEYRGVASYLVTKLFRREVLGLDNHPIRFSEELKVGEDVLFAAECYLRIQEAVYIDESLYHYRQRNNSAMHLYDMRLQTGASCEAYEKIIGLFNKRVPYRVMIYVKRFYVYHASLLLKMAIEKNMSDKIVLYNGKIKKYLWSYIFTNLDHPSRILEMIKLSMGHSRRKNDYP